MASKDISSYFSKPSTPAKAAPAPKRSAPAADESSAAHPASSPLSSTSASLSASGKKSSISEAMRRAIAEGVEEGERDAKRAKVEDKTSKPKTASIFTQTAGLASVPAKINIPTASTKDELIKSLEAHQGKKELLQLELDTLGEDWLLALQDELTKPYFVSLKEFVTKEQSTKKVFPPANDIYSWSRLCPLKDVRVVIIGQDPYHGDGQAHGFAFSVRKGVTVPPSLRNIYKELGDEIEGFKIPKHGDLTEWAKHGVLLLNTSLTVRAHEAGSHSNKGWESFTSAILRIITSRQSVAGSDKPENGVVLMAWGKHAQNMIAGIDKKTNLVLTSAHPSPFAANKGFFGNGHFKKANDWLEGKYGEKGGVDWKTLGAAE